jgi:hypothetical protein
LSTSVQYVARANIKNNGELVRLYVDLFLLKAQLRATTPSTAADFNGISWNQYYFVFVEKEKGSFQVFTPVAKHNLGLSVTQQTLSLAPSPPNGWTNCEFITAGEDEWYWKIKGENLYLSCDPDTGDITLTEDKDKRSTFIFAFDLPPPDQPGQREE